MEDNEQDPLFEARDMPQSKEYDAKRLDYSKPVYRDVYCAIIYYLILALVIGYGVWVTIDVWPQIKEDVQNNADETQEDATDEYQPPDDYSGVFASLVSCAVIGLLFGFIWLHILRSFASFIVKVMVILSCVLWITCTVIAFIYDEIELGIILAICTLFMLLYVWCVWSRIAFAAVLLALGSRIVGIYSGVVCVQFVVVLFSVLWFGWIIFLLYVIGEYKATGWEWIFAGLVLSLFWCFEVNNNISHTTACGVSAVWYFTSEEKKIGGPTYKAFNRSMTTSFGSICLGSLLVAILELIRALVNAALRDSHSCLACLVRCCLGCIEALMRWFNKYAYAHCAIYGVSFMKGASQTWQLFEKEGVMALINDDLSGLGLFAGDLCAFVVCGGVGYGIAYSFYGSDPNPSISQDLVWGLAIFSAIIGAVLCWMVLVVVRSAIVTLFVCFAEEPAILYANRRGDFNKIAEVQPKFQEIHDNLTSLQAV